MHGAGTVDVMFDRLSTRPDGETRDPTHPAAHGSDDPPPQRLPDRAYIRKHSGKTSPPQFNPAKTLPMLDLLIVVWISSLFLILGSVHYFARRKGEQVRASTNTFLDSPSQSATLSLIKGLQWT
jgi:hypothetical protein